MKMTSLSKVQFADLNNKGYYFLNGILSFTYRHPLLSNNQSDTKAYLKIHEVKGIIAQVLVEIKKET